MGKRIAILIPKLYHGGGAERSTRILATLLSEEHTVFLITQHAGDLPETPGCTTISLNQSENFLSKMLHLVPTAFAVSKICKEENIDIVIGKMVRANVITILAKILFGNKTKNILMTHNAKTGRLIHRLALLLYKLGDDNVTVSRGAEQVLRKHGITKVRTIHNAFDFDGMKNKYQEKLPVEHEQLFLDGINFLAVGRLHRQKGFSFLIQAFSKVVTQNPNAKLLIAGEGFERAVLEKKIASLALEKSVILLGNIKNIFPYLRVADCFVLSSLWEGLPTVVIEALFTKTPIITTDCLSGPREILTTYDYADPILLPIQTAEATLITPPDVSYEKFGSEFITTAGRITKKIPQDPSAVVKFSAQHIQSEWLEYLKKF